MKQVLLLSGALAALLGAAPLAAAADDGSSANLGAVLLADASTAGEVDAGKLVGEEVYDGNGDKVGEIDSVLVDAKGKVTSVVIDVSGWLESEKLVAVKWTDLKTDADGKIMSSLTKDSAKAATAYSYKDKNLRGQILTESGERYSADNAGTMTSTDTTADTTDTTAPAVGTAAPATADTNAADNTATATATTDNNAANNDNKGPGELMNADGSLNASKLIGLDVKSPEDKKVGDIGEVVLDKDGKAQGVVVDVGGFLGIGTHPVLLGWQDVTLSNQDGKANAVVNLTKDKLEQMPAYESSSK